MKLVKVGMPEFNEAGDKLLGIMNRWLPEGQWQLTMEFCCDECGAKSDKMIRIEVPISKRKTKPHDICAECLAKAIKMLDDSTS